MEGEELQGLVDLGRLLARGAATGIKEVVFYSCSPTSGSIAPLGEAIKQGKLPHLSKLKLISCMFEPGDLHMLVNGLAAAPCRLRTLHITFLENMRLSEDNITHLNTALEAGGGLGALQKLVLFNVKSPHHKNLDSLLRTLATKAPCSRTLNDLGIWHSTFTRVGARTFMQALGGGAFPNLSALYLDIAWDKLTMKELLNALLALAEAGKPAQLVKLSLHSTMKLATCVKGLAAVFKAGGLPCLTDLNLAVPVTNSPGVSKIFDPWKKLGSRIKLERLGFGIGTPPMSEIVGVRLIEALRDPDVCPLLYVVTYTPPTINRGDLEAMLEQRRQTWEERRMAATAAAAAAAAPGAADEDEDEEEERRIPAAVAVAAAAAAMEKEEDEEDGVEVVAAATAVMVIAGEDQEQEQDEEEGEDEEEQKEKGDEEEVAMAEE